MVKSKRLEQPERPPLGIRLKNPLNIRVSNSRWQGAIYRKDVKFVEFMSFFWGWRAAVVIMARTYAKRGWNTPRLIIEHWAPFTENDTKSYIGFVCKYSGLQPDEPMPPLKENREKWFELLRAMAKMEIGIRWVTTEMLYDLKEAIDNEAHER